MPRLNQGDDGWAHAEFALPQEWTRGRRQNEIRPDPPNHLARLFRRKEESRLHVPEAIEAYIFHRGIWLPDCRRNPADNEIPVFGHANWNYRLNIQHVLSALIGGNIEIAIVLNRDADKAGHWVLRILLQVCSLIGIWLVLGKYWSRQQKSRKQNQNNLIA